MLVGGGKVVIWSTLFKIPGGKSLFEERIIPKKRVSK
jgi:hypothetical protein